MKTLLLSLLLLPLYVLGQAAEPFKKANTIIIQTNLAPEEAYSKWGKYLLQSGYTLAESNKEFLTLNTGPKDTSKMNYDYTLTSTVSDNGDIVIRAKYRRKSSVAADMRASEFYDWYYRGPREVTTHDILKTVQSFENYPITYTKSN